MENIKKLPELRSLGKSEQLSAASHDLGFFKNVGVSAHYSLSTTCTPPTLVSIVYAAVTEVIRKHSILSAIPVDEASPNAYFARLPSIDLTTCVLLKTRSSSIEQTNQDPELDAILQEEHNTDFKADYGTLPFWRLVVLEEGDAGEGKEYRFTASFIFHHSLGDGATGVIFHQSFSRALEGTLGLPSSLEQSERSSSMVNTPTTTTLLPPLEKLHPLPLHSNPPSHRQESEVLKEWTGTPIRLPIRSSYRTLFFSPEATARFAKTCKESGLSVTTGLTAVMGNALFSALGDVDAGVGVGVGVGALTGIIPINLRPWLSLPDSTGEAQEAMGSFIDAIKVQIRRDHYDSDAQTMMPGLPAARHTADAIKKYMGNKSPSGEPYTSVAAFKGIHDVAAVFKSMVGGERDAAFEISNLGRFTSTLLPSSSVHGVGGAGSEAQCRIGRMVFSRSALGFGAAITTSVVTGADEGLSVGWSWQDGVVEGRFVEDVMGVLREGVEGVCFLRGK